MARKPNITVAPTSAPPDDATPTSKKPAASRKPVDEAARAREKQHRAEAMARIEAHRAAQRNRSLERMGTLPPAATGDAPDSTSAPFATGKALEPHLVERTGQLGGFSAFDASDYTVATGKGPNARMLTVSPLRAVMEEQRLRALADGEHVITDRTRQGVLYGAGLGMETSVMARIMGVDHERFQEIYEHEIATAPHLMMSDIQTNLYNIARDPSHSQSVRAGTYLLGKLGNKLYRDEQKRLGDALAVRPDSKTVDVSLLSADQRDSLRTILMAAMDLAAGGGVAPVVVEGDYAEIEDMSGEELL